VHSALLLNFLSALPSFVWWHEEYPDHKNLRFKPLGIAVNESGWGTSWTTPLAYFKRNVWRVLSCPM